MCTECGAAENECEMRFHECLVKEFTDADYGKVHHLTVSAYMLQHSSKLTREGWLYERDLLRDFLVNKRPPDLVRQQNKDVVDSGKRIFKLRSSDGKPTIPPAHWSKTILDLRMENAAEYCEDVTNWASAVFEESRELSTS